MSDLGPLHYFLGIEFSSSSEGLYLSQEKYILDLLDRASLTDQRTIETPMELNVHLRAMDGKPLEDPTCYRHVVKRSTFWIFLIGPLLLISGQLKLL
jgi:hypothetical protein